MNPIVQKVAALTIRPTLVTTVCDLPSLLVKNQSTQNTAKDSSSRFTLKYIYQGTLKSKNNSTEHRANYFFHSTPIEVNAYYVLFHNFLYIVLNSDIVCVCRQM